MTIGESNPLLHCYRGDAGRDAWLAKAVRKVEGDAALEAQLREQVAFDRQIVAAIHSIRPPDDLRTRLEELTAQTAARRPIRRYLLNPAALAVGFGVLLMIGIIVFFQIERMKDFPGKEIVERLLSVTARMDGSGFQPTDLPAGQLGDAMYIGGFEGYALPPQLAKMPALGWRVAQLFGRRVAQVALAEHESVLIVFRATDFGVRMPEPGGWEIMEEDGWAGALHEKGGLCTMIAFRGSKTEMQNFLNTTP